MSLCTCTALGVKWREMRSLSWLKGKHTCKLPHLTHPCCTSLGVTAQQSAPPSSASKVSVSRQMWERKSQLLEMKHNKWRRVWSLSSAYQNTAVVPLCGVLSFHFLNDNVPFADEAVTLSYPDTICGRHHCPLAAPVSPAWTACQGTLATRQSLSAQQLVILQVGPWARLIVGLSKCSLKVL